MSKFSKVLVGFAAVALVLAVAVSPAPASAQTAADLQALIASLQAQITALTAQLGGAAGVPAAPSVAFTRDLMVGSTGEDVRALQVWLNSRGYTVATSGAGSPGNESTYFGPRTKAALAAYQAANGISPAAGYFGPITRAAIAAAGGVPTVPGIPGIPGIPVTPPVTGINDGTDGSLTIAASSVVSSGQQVKKGETKNVLSTRLKATAGAVMVTRVDIKFNERPWLTMSQIQVKDGNGNVLATKSLTGSADATEVVVGSDYRVRVDGLNLTVQPNTDVDLIVAVSVLASSDKITGQTITVSIPESGIRTINGRGFTDSLGPSSSFTFTLPTTGSVADIYTSISPNSPLAGFQNVAAGTTETENVVLGKFRVKAQNTAATLNSVNFNLHNSGALATTTLFSNVRLMAGSLSYGANSLVAGGTTFNNLQIPLPLDQWVELTLTANVAGASTSGGISASSTLVGGSIAGIDANFNSLTVTNASNVTSADRTFLESGVNITSSSGVLGNCTSLVTNGPIVRCGATFNFTLTNTGNNVVYVSKTPGVSLATSTVPTATASSTITILSVSNPTDDAADTATSFAIQAGGSRTFKGDGVVSQAAGTSGAHQLKITGIKFGSTSAANAANTLTTGLGNLQVTATF